MLKSSAPIPRERLENPQRVSLCALGSDRGMRIPPDESERRKSVDASPCSGMCGFAARSIVMQSTYRQLRLAVGRSFLIARCVPCLTSSEERNQKIAQGRVRLCFDLPCEALQSTRHRLRLMAGFLYFLHPEIIKLRIHEIGANTDGEFAH